MRRKGIISYDITNTTLRTRLAKILLGYCTRVQFSVFEFDLDEKIYREMFERIVALYKEQKINKIINLDKKNIFSIRIYELCNSCLRKSYSFESCKDAYRREESIF